MNFQTNLLKVYVNFVDATAKQNTYFKKIAFFFAIVTSLLLFFSPFQIPK